MADGYDLSDLSFSSDSEPDQAFFDHTTGIQPYRFEPEASDNSDQEPDEASEPEIDRLESTAWCSCSGCLCMPTVGECICCNEIDAMAPLLKEAQVGCITQHPGFNPVCLNKYVLETAYYDYRQYYRETVTDMNNRSRYIAYRQLARFVWGYLGKEIRVTLPSCAVMTIRKTFPSPNVQYTGFLEPE